MAKDILTPVGRLVQGSAFEPNTTDAEGHALVVREGPNKGQPRVEFFMAIAVPKTDPGLAKVFADIHAEARESFPNQFDAQGNCINPQFAMKYLDGDSQIPNTRGIRPCDQEGFPGCWVFRLTTGFKPNVYNTGGLELLTDASSVQRGYYIRIYGSVRGNDSTQRPGVYLNASLVEFIAYGKVIQSGPDGAAIFGGAPAVGALPAGASATPLAPTHTIAPQGQPQGQPQVGYVAPQPIAQNAAPAPATDFLNGPSAAPAPPAEPKYLDSNGGAFTEAQLVNYGYTVAQVHALPRA